MKLFFEIVFRLLGRRVVYRMGRALYRMACGDVANDMRENGETLLQECVLNAWKGERLVIFDVGANVGDWSLSLLKLLTNSATRNAVDLFIFEPVPSTLDFLKNRLGAQDCRLHFERVALSAKSGKSKMFVSEQSSGVNSLYPNPLRDDEEQIEITAFSAVDFCKNNNIEKIQLLKCDTEGHDMEIIRGALPLLVEKAISVLQFEYNSRWIFSRNFLRDVFIAIDRLPYKVVKLQPDYFLILNEWHTGLETFFEGNYAIVHVNALNWFPAKQVTWDRYNTMCVEHQ